MARAGLLVALANSPAVLLADEPTGELDGGTEQLMLRMLRMVRERAADGCAVLSRTAWSWSGSRPSDRAGDAGGERCPALMYSSSARRRR
ncbi:hypothetical protein ABZT04_40710 [Streptomyces sp. NPDC005492]|uniref:hypothetical protein n=1 Tax=Streptomyces sp. NPDC005492 TaxID=3156883 RepID=UPI0033B426AF